jgi:hypothetical protein
MTLAFDRVFPMAVSTQKSAPLPQVAPASIIKTAENKSAACLIKEIEEIYYECIFIPPPMSNIPTSVTLSATITLIPTSTLYMCIKSHPLNVHLIIFHLIT